MKILAAGNWESEYIKDSWKYPLEKNYSAVCVNVTPLMAQSDYRNLFAQRYLQSLIRRDRFDFFYFYADGLQHDFHDPFFKSVRAAGLPVVVFHADDEPEKWYLLNKRFDHRYDVVASHSRRGWERRRDDGFGERSLYVPWGYNPDAFYKLDNTEKTYDVVFIGKYKKAGLTALMDEDGNIRQDTLVKVKDICQTNGFSFRVFGLGWENHPELKDFYGGLLSHEKMVEVYNRSRIVFNPGYSSDEDLSGFQTKLRHYEVPGCGAFQLVNHNPELIEQFTPDEETVYYRDDDELREKIIYYLKNSSAREAIALKGYRRAQQDHTTAQRLNTLFQGARRLFPSRPCVPVGPLPRRIARVFIGEKPVAVHGKTVEKNVAPFNATSLEHALDIVKENMSEVRYIHLIPGDFSALSLETDYESIRPFLRTASPDQVISVRSSVQFFRPGTNFIQVNKYSFSGFILSPDLEMNVFEKGMESVAAEYLSPVSGSSGNEYLFNYLIPPHVLLSIMEKLHDRERRGKNDTPLFEGANVLHSCCIVNEFLIRQAPPELCSIHRWRYRKLFTQLARGDKKFVIYGARGNPIPLLVEEAKICGAPLIGFIDRALAGRNVHGYPVYSRRELDTLKPDAILISAENSGPEIFEELTDWQCRAAVIPLYDHNDNSSDAGL